MIDEREALELAKRQRQMNECTVNETAIDTPGKRDTTVARTTFSKQGRLTHNLNRFNAFW